MKRLVSGLQSGTLGLLLLASTGYGSAFSNELAAVQALGNLTNAPVIRVDDITMTVTNVAAGELKAVYFDGLAYSGSPTRVYAYIGIPGGASPASPVPAVVLLHGGGGTAFPQWVELWTNRGYAAISMALEGQSSAMPGPSRSGVYGDTDEPLTNQWMYHAVADTILANSLMRSLPMVDTNHVGMMGISWGGVIVSTVMGIDDRFAFAIPTYGCGHLYDAKNHYEVALANNEVYKQVWDPMVRMSNASMPALWLSWPEDFHYPMDNQAYTYHAAPGARMVSLIPDMGHGHGAGWNPGDSYAFADSIISNGTPWCVQDSITLTGSSVSVEFTSSKTLDQAHLRSTTETGKTGDLLWTTNAATVVSNGSGSWTVTATLPPDTTGWFISAFNGSLVASSDYQENIALILAPGGGLEFEHPLPNDQSTGTVQVAFTAPTNVEIIDITLSGESHPGSFSNLNPLPWVLNSPTPTTSSLEIQLDNTVAGLTNGQSATGIVSVVWEELDGSTDQAELPVRASANFSATAFYNTWATSNGLDAINVNTAAHLNTVMVSTASRLRRDDIGFRKGTDSAWTVIHGVLGNSSLIDSTVAEGAIGRIFDCTAISNLNSSLLSLEFDYSTAEAGEALYVHLWGYVDVSSVSNTMTMNLGAPNGAAWESAGGAMTPYNLGKANGIFASPAGLGTDAAAILTGLTGEQVYSNTFDLSTFTTAPNTVAGYDYLVLGIARQISGTSPAATLRNLVLSVPGGETLMSFVQALPADDLTANPDFDDLVNLLEYGLGGNPTNTGDVGVLPILEMASDGSSLNYVYCRRRDAGARGLTYTVHTESNLLSSSWGGNGGTEVGVGNINTDFERVTNAIDDEAAVFIRLDIGIQE